MEIIVTSLLLFGTAAVLALLRLLRPQFRFGWLLAVAGTAGAWLSVWLWLFPLPISLKIPLWQSAVSADSFATFLVTSASWPYALGLTTLALAVILTAPARTSFPSASTWALSLTVVGLGLLGALAESPLTLVLFWAGLDLVEAGVVLARPRGPGSRAHWPLTFTLRLGSMALVLLGLVLGQSDGSGAGFGAIQGAGAVLLPAAALLRLTTFAAPGDPASGRDELPVVLHLTAGVATVAFLSQLPPSLHDNSLLLGLGCAGTALYGGWMWLRGPDATMARPLWLMGMGSLAVAAMLRANPLGATAWGSSMLLAGTALFLPATHERWANRALLCALLFSSGLPLTLTAAVWTGGGSAQDALLPAFLLAQAMLLAGYAHLSWAGSPAITRPPAGSSLGGFSRAGIVWPLVVGLVLGFWGWPGALQLGNLAATAVVILATGGLVWGKRTLGMLTPSPTDWTPHAAARLLSAMGHELGRLQDMLHRVAVTITRTLEGEAGILWSLVVLVLFASLIVDRAR